MGRDAALAQLVQWWTTARQGTRQVGVIAGESGIGKTALVNTFVAQVAATEDVWVGHGQCLDHYGAGEAYLPLLEALGRLGHGPEGERLVAVLRQYAPSWLVQLPGLVPPSAWESLQRAAAEATQPRMLRELTEALDVLTTARPLVLVVEDLHWSDVSTLAWLAYVARRPDPARLLLLGTYRPVDAIVRAHPIRTVLTDLTQHQQGAELLLDYLSEADVAAYCRQRLWEPSRSEALVHVLHQRTRGHPLFLVTMVDELQRQGLLHEEAARWDVSQAVGTIRRVVPESLRHIIEQQLRQVRPEDQGLLEAASLAGRTFSAAAIAAVANQTTEDIEAQLAVLAHQGQCIQAGGLVAWPDGTVAAGYGFRHDLYREILYDRIPPSRQRRWHLQIGLRKEMGYGAQAREIAAELAGHFVQGRDPARAVQYLRYAGENALQRNAYHEAVTHFTTSIEVLQTLPETPARAQQQLDLQMALGPALMATKGYAAPEVEQLYTRARELCERMGEPSQLFRVLWGLWVAHAQRGVDQTTRVLAEQLLSLAQRLHDPDLMLEAHHALWATLFLSGEPAAARPHLEQGLGLYEPQRHRAHAALYSGHDPGVCCHMIAAPSLWLLGYPDQAVASSQAALALAQQLAHPLSLTFALYWAAVLHHLRREAPRTQAHAEAAMTIATDQEFPELLVWVEPLQGWALAARGHWEQGRALIQQGIAAAQAMGVTGNRPYDLALFAVASAQIGETTEGLGALTEALATLAKSRVRWWEAELYRLRGELLLLQEGTRQTFEEAESCFQQAIAIARRQSAKSLELRTVMSLSRLWQQQGKRAAAYDLLAPVYGWFTEGFDTADLQEAKALLDELEG